MVNVLQRNMIVVLNKHIPNQPIELLLMHRLVLPKTSYEQICRVLQGGRLTNPDLVHFEVKTVLLSEETLRIEEGIELELGLIPD